MDAVLVETPAQKRKRRIKKVFLNLLFAVLAYGALLLAARLLHRKVLYQPPSDAIAASLPEGVSLLTAKAADGAEAHALEIAAAPPAPPPAPPKRPGLPSPPPPPAAHHEPRTIVLFHGNAEVADDNVAFARELRRRSGFGVVLVEYRGYGRSKSAGVSPNEEGLYVDATAILDALAARGIGKEHIVLWGQSLGSGVAVEMAKRGRGARMVLVAPFTSTVDLAKRVVPFLPANLVMVDRFESIAKAPDIAIPVWITHGDIDDVIPFEQGERLSQAFPHATFLKVQEGRHDNLYKNITVVDGALAHAARD